MAFVKQIIRGEKEAQGILAIHVGPFASLNAGYPVPRGILDHCRYNTKPNVSQENPTE